MIRDEIERLLTVAQDRHGKTWAWLGEKPPANYEAPEGVTSVVTGIDRKRRIVTLSGVVSRKARR